MTPAEWYRARRGYWQLRSADLSRRALALSRARVASFLSAAALLGWGIAHRNLPAAIAALAGFIVFGWLVAVHARVLAALERSETAANQHDVALARLARDWPHVPDVPAPASVDINAHPYAADLDLAGRASLAAWLGPAATTDGERHLWEWLLASSDPSDVGNRQRAVEDLAVKREWRESLDVEGALLNVSARDVASFLDWAESSVPALPRAVRMLAIPLTAALWLLLAVFLPPVISTCPFPAQPGQDPDALMRQWLVAWPTPWWLIPFVIGIVVSYACERQICAVFDRAALAERSVRGLSRMLALVCRETWQASIVTAAQARMQVDGDAPSILRTLAHRSEWSELRRGAALLHFPIQAFTLWDFHVLLLIERWRARHGRKVRGWLDSLGEIDALAVLSRVRADEPAWAMPSMDAAANAFEASALGHPLIKSDRRVANDVSFGPRGSILLVTGSNMSGKSTLLRSVGLNAVLAQAGAPVCAASLRMPPVAIYTSIRIQDSLEQGLSYFMASLARLKTIVDAADRAAGGRMLLYLLDELLQGTNSAERGIAVLAVVRHLLRANAIGMMTTHDLALASQPPLSSSARLVHFSEQVQPDGSMTFDYTLRPGLATSTNALRLMQLIGIEPQ